MLTVAGVNVEKEAGERIDSPASDAFSVLYPIPLDKLEFTRVLVIYTSRRRNGLVERFRKERFH